MRRGSLVRSRKLLGNLGRGGRDDTVLVLWVLLLLVVLRLGVGRLLTGKGPLNTGSGFAFAKTKDFQSRTHKEGFLKGEGKKGRGREVRREGEEEVEGGKRKRKGALGEEEIKRKEIKTRK